MLKSGHSVHKGEHQQTQVGEPIRDVRLDDVQTFVTVARTGSFRAASHALGKSVGFISNRMDVLENGIRETLFVRTRRGVVLTKEGQHLLEQAESFAAQSRNVLDYLSSKRQNRRKTVSVSVTEGLGTFWLMPRLVEFHEECPEVLLDFQCQMEVPDLEKGFADIAIHLDRPESEDVVVRKIGTLHIMLFASVDYINRHGKPETIKDLAHHTIVEQSAHQIDMDKVEQLVPDAPRDFVAIRTNTSSSHANAIARGAGIGALPSYARAITNRLVPICADYSFPREIFISYLPEFRKDAKTAKVIDWLVSAFDNEKYPWFAEKFVHPDTFSEAGRDDNVIKMFDQLDV